MFLTLLKVSFQCSKLQQTSLPADTELYDEAVEQWGKET